MEKFVKKHSIWYKLVFYAEKNYMEKSASLGTERCFVCFFLSRTGTSTYGRVLPPHGKDMTMCESILLLYAK